MSNQRFIEISSAYRNRVRYPKPSQFEIPFSPPPSTNQIDQVKGVYNDYKITTKNNNVSDSVLAGIIDYMWYGTTFSSTGPLYYDSGTLDLTLTQYALIDFPHSIHIGFYKNVLIVITDTNTNAFIGMGLTTENIQIIGDYLQLHFSPIFLLSGTHTYTIYPESGLVLPNSTSSIVSVSGLSSVYKTVVDYYVGYQLTMYDPIISSSLIIGYNPSTCTFILQTKLTAVPTSGPGLYITITDPSTNAVITLPGIDSCGKDILDYTQSYNGYYLIDETRSSGRSILSSKIISYNYAIRAVTLEIPFTNWRISDKYSIRKTLPNEFITLPPARPIYGTILSQLNPNTITVNIIGDTTNLNYTGFQIIITDSNGSSSFTILSCTLNNTKIKLSANVSITPFPATFIIVPTFPQLNLLSSNCIFLGSTANTSDDYYKGQYIYIYPQEVDNNQTTSLANIQGSCFYINAYIGNGYNSCFINIVDTPSVEKNTEYFPSYTNKEITAFPTTGTFINIVSLVQDNYVPLIYNGSVVSQNELVAYEISLLSLNLPNITLITGSSIAYYPFVYVEFTVKNQQAPNLIYSNNPKSNKAVFQVSIKDIKDKAVTPFIKLSGRSMTQIIKFKPNDCLSFSVFLPNGKLFETVANDFYCPSGTNPFVQIDALFGIQRIA